jgi:8-oxo-dGTP pyrophosphatase MutT (NUDIX family)
MGRSSARTIRIGAALIDDLEGGLLLVRKAGTPWFMQAGGKIERGESALEALRRELLEEIGLALPATPTRDLGVFVAAAANESNHLVEAELFHVPTTRFVPVIGAEIAEVMWVDPAGAEHLPLAPLTRDHVLPLARLLFRHPGRLETGGA